jgi:hypothetical protein
MASHPFESVFNVALQESMASEKHENFVLEEARALHEGGYASEEIYRALKHLRSTLLKDKEIELLDEVLEEFETYQDE